MPTYEIRAGLTRDRNVWRSSIIVPTRAGEIVFTAAVPHEAVQVLRRHFQRALRDPGVDVSGACCGELANVGDEVAGIWDTIRGLVRTGISALPIPGAGLIAQGVDALGNIIGRRRAAAAPRPAPAPAPVPQALPAPTAPAAPGGLPGLAAMLAQFGLGGIPPQALMGALASTAASLQAARTARSAPQVFAPSLPAGAGGGAFNLFGGAPAASMPLPNFLGGLVGAGDALIGAEMFDVVGGTLDDLPPHVAEWERLGRDPRVREALHAARALHAWMHEHPLRRR